MSTITRQCEKCRRDFEEDSDFISEFEVSPICSGCFEEMRKADEEARRLEWLETRRNERWEQVPAEYRKTDPERPEYPRTIHGVCQRWLRGEGVGRNERRLFLGMIGASGLCKSRVASQMARSLIWEDCRTVWVNSSAFQWAAQNQFNNADKDEASAVLKDCHNAPWLIFDDIGSLKSTEAVADCLYALLEHRTSREMPMIWTSNETIEEMLPKLGEKPRARILGRLDGFSNIIEL